MAREVTVKAIKSLLNHRNGKFGGKCTFRYCDAYGTVNTEIKDDVMYLHENEIAKLENGELYVRFAGYGTVTTRERLQGFSEFGYKISVCQKDFTQYINGEVADLYKWYHIEKF